jgi:CYTH domain-containing protein
MNKTESVVPNRLYLVEKLPEPLTPASEHLQLFDNYIAGTRMRLRQIRDPKTRAWTRLLQQRLTDRKDGAASQKYAELELNEAEYAVFERFEQHEVRKNRYFLEAGDVSYQFDVYLGPLWGVNTARVVFRTLESASHFIGVPHGLREISSDSFFIGENLVLQNLASIREHLNGNAASSLAGAN